ncbi:MAG: tetratricopeptide repeat protein [Chitinispirillaceae bacterium]
MNTLRVAFLVMLCAVFAGYALEFELELGPSDENAIPSGVIKAVDEAYKLNMEGLDALEKKDYKTAMDCFNRALEVFPQYSDALNNRGVVQFRRGDVMGAQRTWEEVVKRDSKYGVGYYNLGLVFLHDKQMKNAKKMFEKAIKRNKKFTEAIVRLGVVYLEMDHKAAALDQFARAYRIAPTHQDAWNFYSYGLLLNKDTTQALVVLKNAGENKVALSRLGRIEGARKNYSKAADYLSRAVKNGAESSVLVELASVQMDGGKCKPALKTLGKYLSRESRPAADAWLLAGYAAKECSGIGKTLQYYEKGLEQYPYDPLLRYNAGQIYFKQKKYDLAEKMWDGLSDSLQEPSLYFMRAVAARARKDLSSAEQFIKKALSMDQKAQYHDFLGVVYHAQKKHKKAEEHFKKALKIDPGLESAQLNLAIKGKSPAELKNASSQLATQLKSCSGNTCSDLAFQLSIIHYYQKDYSKAVSVLSSIDEKRKDKRVYRHLALFYRKLLDYEKAISVLQSAASRFDLDYKTEYELAELHLLAGKPGRAVELFKALLPKIKENPWRLYYQIGYAYMEQNDLTMAKRFFEKSLEARRDNPAARGLLAFVLNRMGKTEQARVHWEKNVKDDPDNPVLFTNLALAHETDGRYKQALKYYKKAQEINPSDKTININLGNVYVGLEKIPKATDAYTRALKSDKRDLAAYNLFLLYKKNNDRAKAEKMSQILQKEFPSSIHTRRVVAEMSFWKGDTSKALSALEGLKEKDEHDWYALGRIYAARGNRRKAQNALAKLPSDALWDKKKKNVLASLAFKSGKFDEAFSLYKQSADTTFASQYNTALTAYNAEKYEVAMSLCRKLVRTASGKNRADVIRLAGNCAFAAKEWKSAKTWYQQLSNVEANDGVVQYNLAVAHYNLGEIEQAYERYQNARKIDGSIRNKDIELRYKQSQKPRKRVKTEVKLDSLDALYNEAVQLHSSGMQDRAEKLYEKIVKRDSTHSQAWNNLGAIYGARGDLEKAESAYLKALRNEYKVPETYVNLVSIYLALEKVGKAREWVARGLKKHPENHLLEEMKDRVSKAK